jgi:AcrR family transcriptional regulator
MEDSPPRAPAPLPRRPQISREYLEDHRRRRYVDAAVELLHEFGREGPTVTNLVRLAGTARNSFYEVFRSAEDCIAYGVGLAAEEMFTDLGAQDGEGEWLAEVAAAVSGFYAAVAAQPLRAELLLVHSPGCRPAAGREALPHGIDRFAALLGRGRAESESRGRRPPPPLLDEYLAWVIATPAERRVRGAEVAALPGESRAVTLLVGSYYLGFDAAEESLAAGPPGN